MTATLERPLSTTGTAHLGRSGRARGWWVLGPIAVLGLLFVYPLVTVVQQTFQDRLGRPNGAVAWRTVLRSREFRTGLWHTVELAVGSTIGCVVLGTFFAIVLAFIPFRGSSAISRMTTVILAFPSFFIALSFAVLYGPTGVLSSAVGALTGAQEALGGFIYTPWAVLLAEVTFYTPFVIRPVLAACKQMQVEQLQVAASLGARPWLVIRRVLLPELLPAIVSGASLCLLLTLNEFGIVLFIGAKGVLTLPVLIYTKGIVSFDYPSAAVLSCVQVALSLLLYGFGRLIVSRMGVDVLVFGRGARRGTIAVFLILLFALLVAPLLVVVLASVASTWNSFLPAGLTTAHLSEALQSDNLTSLSTSIQTALLAGVLAVVIGTWAAMSATRLPRALRSAVDALFHLPVAVPSVVIGLGMLVAFSQRPLLLNGTKWIVIAAQTILVLSFAYSTVSAALLRLDPQVANLAASLGARPARVLWLVSLPMLLPAITAATALAVALCMGELGATIMIYPPTWRTLPVSIFTLSDRGDTYLASADTLILLAATLVLLMLIGRIRIGYAGKIRG